MATLINSDIFIDALRGSEEAKQVLKILAEEKNAFYSSLTIAELLSSKLCDDYRVRESTMKIFSIFEKVNVDDILAQKAAHFRRKYSLPLPDAIIAATAHHLKAELLTANTRDFSKVGEIRVRKPY